MQTYLKRPVFLKVRLHEPDVRRPQFFGRPDFLAKRTLCGLSPRQTNLTVSPLFALMFFLLKKSSFTDTVLVFASATGTATTRAATTSRLRSIGSRRMVRAYAPCSAFGVLARPPLRARARGGGKEEVFYAEDDEHHRELSTMPRADAVPHGSRRTPSVFILGRLSQATEDTNRRMLRARDAMDRDYAQPLDIAALAKIAFVSEAHFIRTFRATFGETPHRYLQRRRVERAMFLLRETVASVTDISLDVGFNSLGTFSRTFTEIVGEPPTTYRWRAKDLRAVPACFTKAWTRPSSFGEAKRQPED